MKKVLSLVLVLALVLGSFSMAFAAETTETNLSDIDGNANEGAIIVANDLGIITGYNDGTFKPDNAVTRAEFAAMMTRALNIPESALKGFKTSAFKDVESSHWAVTYLGYCNSKGIMTGYEDGTARPNQTITVNEAMTMICRALGYTNQAKELVGSWPANYIALGQQLSLYDDVAATAITDRASAAQIVYNALTVPLKYIDADGVTQDLKDGKNNVVTMLGSLGGQEVNNGDGVVLESKDAEKAVINCTEHVGQFVKEWTNSDGEIIAIEVLSQFVTGDVTDTTKDKLFTVDDVDYYFDQTKNFGYDDDANNTTPIVRPHLLANGKTQYTGTAVTTATPLADETENVTLAVKISGKTITEVYSVQTWTKADQGQFDEGDLNVAKAKIDVNGTPYKFVTDKNGDIDYTSFALVGVSSLDKIAKDNVIEVYVSGGFITKLAVGTKTVTGTVSEMNKSGKKFTIDGTTYQLTAKETPAFGDTPEVGQTGTAYLTEGGKIAYWDETDATAGNYGVIIKADTDGGSTVASATTVVGIVLKDGTTKELSLTSSTKIEDPAAKGVNLSNITTAWATDQNGLIVKYSLDSNGKISKIVTVTNAATSYAADTNINDGKTRVSTNKFASNALVFFRDGDDWELAKVTDFSTKYDFSTVPGTYVALNDKNEIVAVSITDKDSATGTDPEYGVINAVKLGTKDGDPNWYVNGFRDGVALSKAWIDGETDSTTTHHTSIGRNGLYKIDVDSTGVVKSIDYTAIPAASRSGIQITDSVDKANKEVTVSGGGVYGLTDNAVVYFWDAEEEEYTVIDNLAIGQRKNIEFFQISSDAKKDKQWDIVIVWDRD